MQIKDVETAMHELLEKMIALLPCSYYMDPPDGGDVSVLEQFRRMAIDAARYRYLCEMKSWPEEINAAFDCSPKGVIDDLIDAAIQKESANVTDEFCITIPNRAKACSSCYGSGFNVGGNLCPCGCRPSAA